MNVKLKLLPGQMGEDKNGFSYRDEQKEIVPWGFVWVHKIKKGRKAFSCPENEYPGLMNQKK